MKKVVLMRSKILILLLSAFIFYSCTEEGASKKAKSFEELGEDKAFRGKHEIPDSIHFNDKGIMLEMETKDGVNTNAYALMHSEKPEKILLIFHEWWGLNDFIKKEAVRFYQELDGVSVMALDLYDGKVATTREEASAYMKAASKERINNIINAAIEYVGPDAKIGTIGWCFGGGWSVKASIAAADQGSACVMYYGMPPEDKTALAPIQAPILGVFASEDKWINEEVKERFENNCEALNKDIRTVVYDADHAFANPSSPRYNESAAQSANSIVLEFLKNNLK